MSETLWGFVFYLKATRSGSRSGMGHNRFQFNPNKNEWLFEYIGLGLSPSLDFDGAALLQSRLVCNLGTFLDLHLLLKEQLAAVARSVFAKIHLVHQLYLFLNWEALQTVTHTLVSSQLD